MNRAVKHACVAAFALLATAAAANEHINYEVQQGDTLYAVSQRYLESAEDWRLLARINRVRDPKRLTPGSILMLPVSRMLGVAQRATVLYVKGAAVARQGAHAPERGLQARDVLDEGTTIQVEPGGFVTVRLDDGSVLHLQGGTRVTLQRLREIKEAGRRQNVIQLDEGRVDSDVSRQPKGSRFDVRTPLAVAGVRGTRFGVSVPAGGGRMLSEVVEGQVAVTPNAGSQDAQVMAGQGAVVAAAGQAPQVRTLLPAPRLELPAGPIERLPFELPLARANDARGYRIQVAEDTQFVRVLVDETGTHPAPRLDGLPDGAYTLRLRAIDADGLMGEETTVPLRIKTQPLPPLARSPLPGQVFGPGAVELRCTEVPGGVAYRLQLARDPQFTTLVKEATQRDQCRFATDLAEPGEYHWRVATLAPDAGGTEERGPFNDASRFTVVPVPVAPEPAVETTDGLTVHWAGAPGERYQVQLAADVDFREIVRDIEVTQSRARLELPAGCRAYFLRLRTISAHGLASPYSAARRVSTPAGVCTSDGAPVNVRYGTELGTQSP
ncbi:FecR domain-containing protein [Schlegelella sp. S2-27]|uniref:FecR domain-containing protein n=1 Tax=Caldimonas mangrovi TaxID=2944811 RepID=A0ABT0YP35_9BURK|nr:FecR domain-containing protein [Caldimonas mangrovi]MCM5680471.1 FecR domain-containing protein [Caldimonas mangrovi]